MSEPKTYDALVIGGGVNGLSALVHLARRGRRPIGLVERFEIGHTLGSSHGAARIIRSTYVSSDWVRLTQAARREDWPRLEREAGVALIHPREGCFFGPPGPVFERYAAAVASTAGKDVLRLDAREARLRFPWFRFDGLAGALCDLSAGIVAAADTLGALTRLALGAGADLLTDTRVLAIDPTRSPIRITTDRGDLACEHLIVTAGAWTARLVPGLAGHLGVARQSVGYFELGPLPAGIPEHPFPVWVYLDEGDNNVFYGLPPFGGRGMKIGRHVTAGRADDPDHPPDQVAVEALWDLERFLARELTVPIIARGGAEHCLYTNTPTEDFVLDLLPGQPRVALGAGFSGHGFKFGPLTGRILAELVLDGRTTVPEFEAMRAKLAYPSSPSH